MQVYPNARTLVCSFHVLQAWKRWTTKHLPLNQREPAMQDLKAMLNATDERDFSINRTFLASSSGYGAELDKYLKNEWDPYVTLWYAVWLVLDRYGTCRIGRIAIATSFTTTCTPTTYVNRSTARYACLYCVSVIIISTCTCSQICCSQRC